MHCYESRIPRRDFAGPERACAVAVTTAGGRPLGLCILPPRRQFSGCNCDLPRNAHLVTEETASPSKGDRFPCWLVCDGNFLLSPQSPAFSGGAHTPPLSWDGEGVGGRGWEEYSTLS